MMGRLLAIAGGIAVGAVAAAAIWAKRKAHPRSHDHGAHDSGHVPAGSGASQGAGAVQPDENGSAALGAEDPAGGDDLRSVKGIGKVSEERLHANDIDSYEQIAAWSDEDVDAMALEIKVSADRIRREDWVDQAQRLVEGNS